MSSIKWLILVGVIVSVAILAFTMENVSRSSEKNSDNGLPTNYNESQNNATYINEYSLPVGTWPNGILVDKNGIIWIAGSKTDSLFRFDTNQGKILSYPIKDKNSQNYTTNSSFMVWTMLQDNDGYIWFSQLGTKSIWKFDPNTDKFTAFHSVSAAPFQMKIDKDGNIWYTITNNTVGVVQKTQSKTGPYRISEFNIGNGTQPTGLFLENNNLWITEIAKQKIVKYQIISDSGIVTNIEKMLEIPTDEKISFASPTDLFVQNDTIWLTEHGTSFITEYQIDSKNLTRFPTSQNAYHVTTLPFWIREVNGGKGMWINEHEGNKIAFFDTVNKTLTEYAIPSRPADGYLVYPLNIAADPSDGNKLWFSEWNTDKFGMVSNTIPAPFDIHSEVNKIVLSNESFKQQTLNIEISKNSHLKNNLIYLNASSSIQSNAGLGNMSIKFSADVIDLAKMHTAQLLLQDNSVPIGNYMLGISASDGMITKTIFLDLQIR
ncbi:Virginiamycin B lyase [uncultured archaeon]|nr:Virginiamycin B lyase [uncultured archaeon]